MITFDLLPAFLMAVLACWLGLSLLVRAPREGPTRAFAWLCLHLALYGLTAALPRLTAAPEVALALQRIQVVETVLLPPVFLHFSVVLGSDGPRPRWQGVALGVFYAIGAAMALYAAISPAMLPVAGGLRFPGGPLVALWAAQRVLPLLLALLVLLASYRRAGADEMEQRRRGMLALAAVVGVVGALWAAAARELGLSPAGGHALMDVALALLAYAVLAYRSLLPPRVARRAFYRSLLGGALTALYVGAVLALEPLSRRALQIDTPLLTIFALVILIALFGPLRDWAGAWLDQRFFHREFNYGQLLRAVGDDLFERGDLAGQLHSALGAICRTLDVRAGIVAVHEGDRLRLLAAYGAGVPAEESIREVAIPEEPRICEDDWEAWPAARLLLPLRRSERSLGLLALADKRSGEPYREVEQTLLRSLGSYLALAIKHGRAQQEEELAMAALAEQSRQLREEQRLLEAQAATLNAAQEAAPRGLRVFALGPLRVERDGALIERWGGDKAGTYQAEALFAFLFDRRGHGLTRDEAEEVIWPDLELDKGDMAFHRTISALRRTLEPGLRRGNESRTITYHHERYWLDPSVVAWCDADAFVAGVERGHTLARQGQSEAARACFAEALALYRGDYMDDCPFFGDSSYVEERRAELRDQYRDALLALGAIYERLDQAGEASTCYRRALAAAGGDCPRAEAGLARLQLSQV